MNSLSLKSFLCVFLLVFGPLCALGYAVVALLHGSWVIVAENFLSGYYAAEAALPGFAVLFWLMGIAVILMALVVAVQGADIFVSSAMRIGVRVVFYLMIMAGGMGGSTALNDSVVEIDAVIEDPDA